MPPAGPAGMLWVEMAKRPATPEPSARLPDASSRFVVLHGEEFFLRQLRTQALREALEKAQGRVDVVTFDGEKTPAHEVLDECRSFGLIATHKLVIVDSADQLVKEDSRPLFERYAQAIIDAKGDAPATLVLRAKTWRAGNLDKLIAQVGAVVKCEPLDEGTAISWAVARCKKEFGGVLERDAAHLLVVRVGTDLGRLNAELGKLVAAAGEGDAGAPAPIGRELVSEFVGVSREEEIWSIQSQVLGATPAHALGSLRSAIEVSRHPPALVFFALTDLARKLHAAGNGMRQGMNAWQLKGSLKLWGSSGDAIADLAGKISPSDARGLLDHTLECLLRSRTGLGDDARLLERAVLRFGQVGGRRP